MSGSLVVVLQTGPVDSVLAPLYWILSYWSDVMFWLARGTGLELLEYQFMHRAILVGLCIGVIAT